VAEQAVKIWCAQHGTTAVILRLPLIAGSNPPGNLGAMIGALKKGYYVRIGDGSARKSMVGAGSIAAFLPQLINQTGTYNLTDGRHPRLSDIEDHLAKAMGLRVKSFPARPLQWAAKIGDVLPFFPLNSARLEKLTATLTFADDKARRDLGWHPTPALDELIVD
jgi:nucleoside-diphosphate-sugar epimerase